MYCLIHDEVNFEIYTGINRDPGSLGVNLGDIVTTLAREF